MKKYILAMAIAICALVGPAVSDANAQVFYRGGPTFIDRLVGNGYGYGGYPSYGGYGGYGYNPYMVNRVNYNPYGYGYGGWGCHRHYGWGGGWGGGWHHHHHW